MPTTTVRASEQSVRTLHQLAEQTGQTMQAILDRAVEEYARQQFFHNLHDAFARVRADPVAWEEELEERRAWDVTLHDDLKDE